MFVGFERCADSPSLHTSKKCAATSPASGSEPPPTASCPGSASHAGLTPTHHPSSSSCAWAGASPMVAMLTGWTSPRSARQPLLISLGGGAEALLGC